MIKTDWIKSGSTWFLRPIFNNTYDWATEGINNGGSPIIVSSDTFQQIAELTVPNRDAGTYQITFTTTFNYDTVQRSAIFRWSLDGGSNWKTISRELKDKTNDEIISYSFPKLLTAGAIDFKMEARCEGGSDTLTIDFAHIILERKK